MKIRRGFVSNSSSTSFCVYGAEIEYDDFIAFLPQDYVAKKLLLDEISEEDLPQLIEEHLSDIFEGTSLYAVNSWEQRTVYIGRELVTLRDDETGKEFKDSVLETLKEIFDDDDKLSRIKLRFINEEIST